MADFEELKTTLILRLYEQASAPGGNVDFTGREIIDLLGDLTGAAIAQQVFEELLSKRLLTQTMVISDEEEMGRYELTPSLIKMAEGIRNTKPQDAPKISFKHFRNALLVALANSEEKGGPGFYDLKEVADQAGLEYRKGWVRKAAYDYRDSGYIQEAFHMGGGEDGGLDCGLTGGGLEVAEELMEQFEESTSPNSVPASNRVVTLDHNKSDYREAVDAVDKVINAVAGDNEYGSENPEEKEALVGILIAARKLLDAIKVKIAAIQAFLLPALHYVADNFAKGAIAALGAVAVAVILALFGIV